MLACCIVSAVVLGLISHLQTSPARRRRQPLIASGSPAILLLQKVGRAPTSASSPTISSCSSAIFRTTSTTRSLSNFSQVSSFVSLRVFHTSDTPFTWYNLLYNRFDNWLYRVNKHPTGCQTEWHTVRCLFTQYSRFSNRFDNHVERTDTVRSAVVKPGCTTGLTTGCIHDTAGCQMGLTTGLTTGCIV